MGRSELWVCVFKSPRLWGRACCCSLCWDILWVWVGMWVLVEYAFGA